MYGGGRVSPPLFFKWERQVVVYAGNSGLLQNAGRSAHGVYR